MIVVLPLTVLTAGRVFRAIALGTGDNTSKGGTVLWETHAHGVAGVLLYRVAPIVVSALLSWWAVRRLGQRSLDPVPLMALVAVSLGLRLVFEESLNTYYFMALTVTLVLLEATRGSIRRTVVAWLVALTVVICRISFLPFGRTRLGPYFQTGIVPLVLGSAVVLAFVVQLLRRGDSRNLWPWAAVAAVEVFFVLPGGANRIRCRAGHLALADRPCGPGTSAGSPASPQHHAAVPHDEIARCRDGAFTDAEPTGTDRRERPRPTGGGYFGARPFRPGRPRPSNFSRTWARRPAARGG